MEIADVYQPPVGLRSRDFLDVPDILDLRGEMDRAVMERRAVVRNWVQ